MHVGSHGIFSLINGGSGGRSFRFYYSDRNTPIEGHIYISGNGRFSNTARTDVIVEGTGGFHLSDQASFESNSSYKMGSGPEAFNHTFSITGSNATTDISSIDAYVTNPNSSATFLFIADNRGISTLSAGVINFDGGAKNAAVVIDTTKLTGPRHSLTLATYDATTLGGEFSQVRVIGGSYGIESIDYNADDGTSIKVDIPEPQTYAAILGILCLATVAQARRSARSLRTSNRALMQPKQLANSQ